MLYSSYKKPFIEGAFLLKLTTPTKPSLLAMTHGIDSNSFQEDFNFFEYCTPTSHDKIKSSRTFVCNRGEIQYYILAFLHHGDTYEFIIKSYQKCCRFFLDFMKELIASFMEELCFSAYDPNNLFIYSNTLLSSWPTKISKAMHLAFPKGHIPVKFDPSDFSYAAFKPSRFFKPKDYVPLFLCLISNNPILLVVPNAVYGCRACFSCFRLCYPLQYNDNVILWLRNTDPRYQEIKESEMSPYYVVATDDPSGIESKFKYVFKCHKMREVNDKYDNDFEEYVKQILCIIQQEFDNLNNVNPYSDLLNVTWINQNIMICINDPKLSWLPRLETLVAFEKSKSCKNWRKLRCRPAIFRHSLLQSNIRIFRKMSIDQLIKVNKFIDKIREEFKGDIQPLAILKKHQARINKILKRANKKADGSTGETQIGLNESSQECSREYLYSSREDLYSSMEYLTCSKEDLIGSIDEINTNLPQESSEQQNQV
ncbi:hypothetical protein TRFO_39990 [Tritrichomonas foetus]|uniref:UDENN domain-containing protein n=1 Tax=Tritrichomonas foetus TaxID=1144522 RepID=A0A1J4J2Z7_9EUKA|nr:hypothetical protein TRFO_39990 [Tritrichomonas foetus]|eukprot:OHS93722.1 hypothetical protein TRFO_39990 [Tritrichomonas foetus]